MEGDMERHSALPYPRCARARRQRTYLDGRYRVCRCYAMKIPGKPLGPPAALLAAGLAPPERLAELERVAGRYAVAITPALMDLMDPGDPDDPLGRQVVPIAAELDFGEGERADPIGDEAHAPVAGIVHRYPDRALLKIADVCAAYCRFCFRREKVGSKGSSTLPADVLAGALAYI